MKKIFIIIVIISAFACQKESSDSLEYTAWSGYNGGVQRMVNFQSGNTCTDYFYVSPSPPGYIAYELSYSHTGNSVKLIQATGTYATGTISGNTLTMDYGYEGGIWIMTKR